MWLRFGLKLLLPLPTGSESYLPHPSSPPGPQDSMPSAQSPQPTPDPRASALGVKTWLSPWRGLWVGELEGRSALGILAWAGLSLAAPGGQGPGTVERDPQSRTSGSLDFDPELRTLGWWRSHLGASASKHLALNLGFSALTLQSILLPTLFALKPQVSFPWGLRCPES